MRGSAADRPQRSVNGARRAERSIAPTYVRDDGYAICVSERFADRTFDSYRAVLAAGARTRCGRAARTTSDGMVPGV
ncbi:hypothetical protein AB0C02_32240 [Micromonospora sp. NPDC048999]|uniref:hypothetical protein n=1 Tax=Micromonospora sp. NPDC048999 TaxID=3155391 RepID=UPI003404DBAC